MAGRVDDDEGVVLRHFLHRLDQRVMARVFLSTRGEGLLADAAMGGNSKVLADMRRPFASVFDVTGQTSLPGVQIDGGDCVPGLDQSYGDVNCDRRFA